MKRFLNWLGRSQGTRPAGGNRHRTFRPQLEELDSRLVPSALSSAISIQHNGWVEQDWYTIQNNHVVEFQGTSRRDLGGGNHLGAVSASIDPNTGAGEVFVTDYLHGLLGTDSFIYLIDSHGTWQLVATPSATMTFVGISATRDGHVYAATSHAFYPDIDVYYLDANGHVRWLGEPKTYGIHFGSNTLAASVGWWGGNEVFAIGQDGAIYVNRSNSYGDWQIVDNQAQFVSLSAASNDTVFAVTTDGRLFQETEQFISSGWLGALVWTSQDVSGGRQWTQISADTDASGACEVYSIEQTTNALFLYDQGSRTLLDYGIQDISAAGGGSFYDVSTSGYAWQYNPNVWPYWTYLGSNFQ